MNDVSCKMEHLNFTPYSNMDTRSQRNQHRRKKLQVLFGFVVWEQTKQRYATTQIPAVVASQIALELMVNNNFEYLLPGFRFRNYPLVLIAPCPRHPVFVLKLRHMHCNVIGLPRPWRRTSGSFGWCFGRVCVQWGFMQRVVSCLTQQGNGSKAQKVFRVRFPFFDPYKLCASQVSAQALLRASVEVLEKQGWLRWNAFV